MMRTEKDAWSANGLLSIALIIFLLFLVALNIYEAEFIFVTVFTLLIVVLLSGLTVVKPNEAKIILLFGKYLGTIRQEGLIYTVPFTNRKRMSLKIKTLRNDFFHQFHDIEINVQTIIFYKVVDTAKVLFEVEQFEHYIKLQSEIILKSLLQNESIEKLKAGVISEQVVEQFASILTKKVERLGIDIIDLSIVK